MELTAAASDTADRQLEALMTLLRMQPEDVRGVVFQALQRHAADVRGTVDEVESLEELNRRLSLINMALRSQLAIGEDIARRLRKRRTHNAINEALELATTDKPKAMAVLIAAGLVPDPE